MDVVLDCFLVEEGRHRSGFPSSENMVKALLVLRQVPMLDDGSLEGFTDFQGGTQAKDSSPVTFEASGKSLCPVCQSFRAPSTGTTQFPVHPPTSASHVLSPAQPLCCPSPPVNLVQIPQAEALLHADCSGQEVTCEISRYFLRARQEATTETAAWFITNMQISEGGPSVSIVMKTLRDAHNGAVLHPTLHLPLGPQGTVQTAGKKMKRSKKKVLFF